MTKNFCKNCAVVIPTNEEFCCSKCVIAIITLKILNVYLYPQNDRSSAT